MSDDDRDESSILSLGKALSKGTRYEHLFESAEQFAEVADLDGKDVDKAILGGGVAGLSQSRGRQQPTDEQQKEAQRPAIDTREIEHPDGTTAGVRLTLSVPHVGVEKHEDGLILHTGDHTFHKGLPFRPHEIEVEQSEPFTEITARPAPMLEGGDGGE